MQQLAERAHRRATSLRDSADFIRRNDAAGPRSVYLGARDAHTLAGVVLRALATPQRARDCARAAVVAKRAARRLEARAAELMPPALAAAAGVDLAGRGVLPQDLRDRAVTLACLTSTMEEGLVDLARLVELAT